METINHECYVSLEVAKLLKEAGFDWELNSRWQDWGGKNSHEFILKTDLFYTDRPAEYDGFHALPAPTLSVAQKWLREERNVSIDLISNKWGRFDFRIQQINVSEEDKMFSCLGVSAQMYDTYESALEAGINKCLTLLLKEE